MKMTPHPRLYTTRAELDRLREPVELPILQRAAAEMSRQAEEYAGTLELKYNPDTHNALLVRAREMQARVVTLLVRWRQTGETRFRAAAMDHLRAMAAWEHWSWDAWLYADPDFHHWYDLSYGENATTLALAYDWLHETLTREEHSLLVEQARARGLEPFVSVVEQRPSPNGYLQGTWVGSPYSNWNTVCAGGAGMLALAMSEEFPELAERVLALAEDSMRPYFEGLRETNGGWVEGIGYWNYGHRYGFMYLFSHTNATGRPHPFLSLPGVRETLSFPMDFVPNGQFCSFPDVNTWSPLSWHYKAAVQLDRPELIPLLDTHAARSKFGGAWPEAAEFLTLHPRISVPSAAAAPSGQGVAKLYPRLDWGILADRLPDPQLYMSIRGGSTDDPHAMVDVLSFNVVVGSEKLIHNYSNEGGEAYMHTTFSERRNDIFENGQPAKNVPMINGVGLPDHARVDTRPVEIGGQPGFRLEATTAYGFLWPNKPLVEFAARLFLMLDRKAFLILDRFELPQTGRTEARMHSFADVAEQETHGFLLRGRTEALRIVYACDAPAKTATAIACPTMPERGANVLRWCTLSRTQKQVTMATLLVPGDAPATLRLADDGKRLQVEAAGEGWRSEVSTSLRLEP